MPEPIFLTPHYDARPWGGTALNRLLNKRSQLTLTGESWEVSARPEGRSFARRGPYAGMALDALYKAQPALFGTDSAVFPLLIKFIDASRALSVQVHPDDSAALEMGAEPKTEAWVVLYAEPGAKIAIGGDFADGGGLLSGISDGSFEKRLNWHDARAGDTFFIPGGTLHAIGPGIVIYEVQQPSDTTYRVYDWGRGRALHTGQSAQCYRADAPYAKHSPPSRGTVSLVKCPYFSLMRIDAETESFAGRSAGRFLALSAMGRGSICWNGGSAAYALGDSFIIPAGMGDYRLSGGVLYAAAP